MKPLIVKRLLMCACALLVTWAVSNSTDAGHFYHAASYGPAPYYTGYGPTPYYAGYGPTPYYAAYGASPYYAGYGPRYYGYRPFGGYSYRARYRAAYFGGTPWSASYASYHVASACGSGCNTGCNPCGVSYGACGTSCDPCGLSSSGGCATGECGTGISSTGSGGTGNSSDSPGPQQSSPYIEPGSGPSTYEPDGTEGNFQQPSPSDPDQAGSGGVVLPEGAQGGGGEFNVQREANKPADETIHQRKDAAPADAEPADEAAPDGPPVPPPADAAPEAGDQPNADDQPEADAQPGTDAQPEADVQPLGIDFPIAAGMTPARTRVRYSVRFHAPRIARVDISPNTRWTPVDVGAKLAVNK